MHCSLQDSLLGTKIAHENDLAKSFSDSSENVPLHGLAGTVRHIRCTHAFQYPQCVWSRCEERGIGHLSSIHMHPYSRLQRAS